MIGKVLATLLTGNENLTALVPGAKIFPYIINENTPLPAIIYTVENLDVTYTKEGWAVDEYDFSVSCFSEDYANLQDIVLQVRDALELSVGVYNNIRIQRIYVSGQEEGYNLGESVFMNRLSFKVGVTEY